MAIKKIIIFTLLLLMPFLVKAQEEKYYDDDFVTASILYADPGEILYSLVGHVGIRMQCPTYDMDYVFTYESEDVRKKVLAFLSGKLKMGLCAVPTQEYLDQYKIVGRGVKQYTLNLPIDAKRNLWKILDDHMMEGMDLPYDYLERGCAHSALSMIKEGIAPLKLEYGEWPDYFSLTRREITGLQMSRYVWTWSFLNLIGNGSIDRQCSKEEKIIMPSDLITILSDTKVDGKYLLSDPEEILPSIFEPKIPWFTPLYLSIILLLLTIVFGILRKPFMDYTLLAIQTILGSVSVYLVFFSTLVCTEWSWLIVPLNPLPLILWKWRRYWALPYAGVCLVWVGFICFSKHMITDWPYVVLALSLAISYIFMYFRMKRV